MTLRRRADLLAREVRRRRAPFDAQTEAATGAKEELARRLARLTENGDEVSRDIYMRVTQRIDDLLRSRP